MNKDGNNSDQQPKSGLQPPNDPINQQNLTNKKNQLDKNTLLAVKKSEQINQINNNTKIQQVDSGKILRNFFVKFNDFFKASNASSMYSLNSLINFSFIFFSSILIFTSY